MGVPGGVHKFGEGSPPRLRAHGAHWGAFTNSGNGQRAIWPKGES